MVAPENFREHLTNSDKNIPIQKSSERDYHLQIQINFHLAIHRRKCYVRTFFPNVARNPAVKVLEGCGEASFKKFPTKKQKRPATLGCGERKEIT